jgi:hypothetical protein
MNIMNINLYMYSSVSQARFMVAFDASWYFFRHGVLAKNSNPLSLVQHVVFSDLNLLVMLPLPRKHYK